MAIYIEIKKTKEDCGIYYYLVSTEDFQNSRPFYVAIDATNKMVYFFKHEGLDVQQADFKLNLNEPISDSVLSFCDWIDLQLMVRVLSKIIGCFRGRKFGEYISYQA